MKQEQNNKTSITVSLIFLIALTTFLFWAIGQFIERI